jgi:hypothetical protein
VTPDEKWDLHVPKVDFDEEEPDDAFNRHHK